MDIWQFQSTLTRRLLIWSFLSMLGGTLLQFSRSVLARSLGQQFAGWGFIDAMIAFFGRRAAQKRAAQLPDPLVAEVVESETRNLRRLLWLNSGLDVAYIVAGVALAHTKGKAERSWRGHGFGIIIQAVFLLVFDLLHALKLRKPL